MLIIFIVCTWTKRVSVIIFRPGIPLCVCRASFNDDMNKGYARGNSRKVESCCTDEGKLCYGVLSGEKVLMFIRKGRMRERDWKYGRSRCAPINLYCFRNSRWAAVETRPTFHPAPCATMSTRLRVDSKNTVRIIVSACSNA